MATKFKNAAFTLFSNPNWETIEKNVKTGKIIYLVVGLEIAPETKKEHLQGYIQLKGPYCIKGIQKIIGNETYDAHIEKARASADENRNYCIKDGNFREWGQLRIQGERTDIDSIKESVLANGQVPIELIKNYQQLAFAERLQKYAKPPERDIIVKWYYGPTGTGKTMTAYQEYPDAWISTKDLNWFDGYTGQKTVIFDDFRGDFATMHWLLRLLDKYPLRVPFKGGFVIAQYTTVIITAPMHPTEIYKSMGDDKIEQLLRRIHEIKFFGTVTGEEKKLPLGNTILEAITANAVP